MRQCQCSGTYTYQDEYYTRYRCKNCGKVFRHYKRLSNKHPLITGIMLVVGCDVNRAQELWKLHRYRSPVRYRKL